MKERNKTPGTIKLLTISGASFVSFNAKISGFLQVYVVEYVDCWAHLCKS